MSDDYPDEFAPCTAIGMLIQHDEPSPHEAAICLTRCPLQPTSRRHSKFQLTAKRRNSNNANTFLLNRKSCIQLSKPMLDLQQQCAELPT